MEDTKKMNQQNMCPCCNGTCNCMGGYHHHGMYRHMILRIILLLILIGLVFHVGMRVGEFKSEMESGYGYGMHSRMMGGYMQGTTDQNFMYNRGSMQTAPTNSNMMGNSTTTAPIR